MEACEGSQGWERSEKNAWRDKLGGLILRREH